MKEALLVYPHQLFKAHPAFAKNRTVFLIEEPLMFTQYLFHKQKLMLHRASMRAYNDMLTANGHTVVYIESKDIQKTEDIAQYLLRHEVHSVYVCDVSDDWLEQKLMHACSKNNITINWVESPQFLTSKQLINDVWRPQVKSGKKLLMHNFYVWQRKRLQILIDENNKPTSGAWSYDADNRKKLPKSMVLPAQAQPSTSTYTHEARTYVEKYFKHNYGTTDSFNYAVTHTEAQKALHDFLHHSFEQFGPYEDSMTTQSNTLFHSILSPYINNGLLIPQDVINQALDYAREHNVPLPSLEGFVRQIIGWREYMRLVYMLYGRESRSRNYFNATRTLSQSFWTATTGLVPVDDVIQHSLKTAYTHHIPRLMVMGNIMNLCGIEPHDVYKWFMEMYIDAYDWVMVPNVYSMALYADGGTITTKPYICGSSYILKMSDYKKGEWTRIWDALFWNFVGKHYTLLEKEGRLGFIGIQYKKMDSDKKKQYEDIARIYLENFM